MIGDNDTLAAVIAQSVKAVTLLKTDRYSRGVVKLSTTDPSLSSIDWERTRQAFVSTTYTTADKSKQPCFELQYLGGGEYAIGYAGSRLTTAKGGTVKLPVYLAGNESAKPNATISVSVKLA